MHLLVMFILQVFMSFGWATGTISVLSLIILSMADSSQEIPVCCDIDNSCFLFLLFFLSELFFLLPVTLIFLLFMFSPFFLVMISLVHATPREEKRNPVHKCR